MARQHKTQNLGRENNHVDVDNNSTDEDDTKDSNGMNPIVINYETWTKGQDMPPVACDGFFKSILPLVVHVFGIRLRVCSRVE